MKGENNPIQKVNILIFFNTKLTSPFFFLPSESGKIHAKFSFQKEFRDTLSTNFGTTLQ